MEDRDKYWEGKIKQVMELFPLEDTDLFKSQEDWEKYLKDYLVQMPCVMINSILKHSEVFISKCQKAERAENILKDIQEVYPDLKGFDNRIRFALKAEEKEGA